MADLIIDDEARKSEILAKSRLSWAEWEWLVKQFYKTSDVMIRLDDDGFSVAAFAYNKTVGGFNIPTHMCWIQSPNEFIDKTDAIA